MKTIETAIDTVNKFGDTSTIFKLDLKDDNEYVPLDDKNVVLNVANDTGLVLTTPMTTFSGHTVMVDFSSHGLAELTPDSYNLEIEVTYSDGDVSKFPTKGGLKFNITNNLKETTGALVPTVTFDNVLEAVDEKIAVYMDTVKVGPQGPKGDTGEGVVDQNADYTWTGTNTFSNKIIVPELIDARKDIDGVAHQSLSERLESTDKVTKVYDSIDDLRAADLNNGNTVKTQYNNMVQNWKIGVGGRDNGHSMIRMNNGLYASRVYDKYNNWLDGIGARNYAAHKGFNGISESTKRNGIYPSNTLASFNAAAKAGFNFIELDARCTSDGDWVVIHDADTTYTDGEKTNISDITTDDLKKRTLLSEYIGYGYRWIYKSETTGYTIPMLKDVLQVAKSANMHVMIEIKVDSATDEQIEKFVDDIKKSGIEDKIVLFGGAIGLVEKIAEFVPNIIVGFMGFADTESNINEIKSFKNHYLTVSVDEIDRFAPICQKFGIPFGVWTVDSYAKAQTAFNKGAMFVTTNRLLPNSSCTNMKPYQAFNLDDLLDNFSNNGTGGTTSANLNGEVSIKSNGTYFSKTKLFATGQVKRGAVIKITCTAKTVSANPSTNVGRIYVNNTNNNDMGLVEDVMTFDDNYFTTKTMYYPITEDMESYVTTLSVGFSGQGIFGTSEMLIKDFDCTVLVPATIDLSTERYCNIYTWDGAPIIEPTIRNKGITSIAVDSSDNSVLNVNYEPFYDALKKPVVFATTDNRGLATGYNNNRFVVPSSILSGDNIVKLNVYNVDGTKVKDLRTGLRTSFNLLIKG